MEYEGRSRAAVLDELKANGFGEFKATDAKSLDELPADQLAQIFTNAARAVATSGDSHQEDRKEYESYLRRVGLRMQHLQK